MLGLWSMSIMSLRALVFYFNTWDWMKKPLKAHYAEGLMLSCKYNSARSSPIIASKFGSLAIVEQFALPAFRPQLWRPV